MHSVTVFLIVAGSFSVVLVPVLVFGVFLRRRYIRLRDSINQHWKPSSILMSNANSFGQESLGVKQVRGNGIIVLTNSEVYFEMLMPKKSWTIPVSSIQAVENPTSHLGKTRGIPLLKVVFQNQQGAIDSIVWQIHDVSIWTKTLQEMIQKKDF